MLYYESMKLPTSMSSPDDQFSDSTAGDVWRPTGSGSGLVERERTFACPEPGCPGRFHRKFTLREHIKTHTGEKPYQCPIKSCGKRFTTSGNLSRHRRLHMVKRICCPVDDCTRIFTKQEKLVRHLKVHMGNAAHTCSYPGCPKTFSTSGNLSRHQRTQHRERAAPLFHVYLPPLPPHAHAPLSAGPSDTTWQVMHQPPLHSFQQTSLLPAQHTDGVSDSDIADLLDCLFHMGGSDGSDDTRMAFSTPNALPPAYLVSGYHHSSPSDHSTAYF